MEISLKFHVQTQSIEPHSQENIPPAYKSSQCAFWPQIFNITFAVRTVWTLRFLSHPFNRDLLQENEYTRNIRAEIVCVVAFFVGF